MKILEQTNLNDKEVIGKECRFVTYVPPPDYDKPDLHVAKEIIHYSDGTTGRALNLLFDHKFPFYITKKGSQNHKSKKEWEDKDNLLEFKSTQANLPRSIARALKVPLSRDNLKHVCTSPYVYGADILGTAIIKEKYSRKYASTVSTRYSVGVCDTETDVIHGTGEIIMASFTSKSVVFTAVVKSFIQGYSDVETQVERLMQKYLKDVIESRKIKSELVIVDTPVHAVIEVIKKAHEVSPDFLTFWNVDFDISKILEACEKYNVDPKDIFSDPSLPPEYRYFKYVRGKDKKITASGKVTPIKPANRWHTVYTPASFYIVDSMCVYRQLRLAKQELQSYALDAVLKENKLGTKLKFEEANEYTGLKWHQFMQSRYPLEYIVYNRYDCICVEILDELTGDLGISMPMFSGNSDFRHFNSQPRRIVDDLHYEVMEDGKIIGTTGNNTNDKDDDDGDVDDLFDLTGLINYSHVIEQSIIEKMSNCWESLRAILPKQSTKVQM